MDIRHHDCGTTENSGPTNTRMLFKDLTSERALIRADNQFALIEEVESRPEEVRHLVMEEGDHCGHSGEGVALVLAKGFQLVVDPFVSMFQYFFLLHFDPPGGGRCGLLSAKGGLMMGTKKVGAPSSPQKRATSIIAEKSGL